MMWLPKSARKKLVERNFLGGTPGEVEGCMLRELLVVGINFLRIKD